MCWPSEPFVFRWDTSSLNPVGITYLLVYILIIWENISNITSLYSTAGTAAGVNLGTGLEVGKVSISTSGIDVGAGAAGQIDLGLSGALGAGGKWLDIRKRLIDIDECNKARPLSELNSDPYLIHFPNVLAIRTFCIQMGHLIT